MITDQRRSWLVATALFLMLVLSYSSAYLVPLSHKVRGCGDLISR